jgi:hypothetical protein
MHDICDISSSYIVPDMPMLMPWATAEAMLTDLSREAPHYSTLRRMQRVVVAGRVAAASAQRMQVLRCMTAGGSTATAQQHKALRAAYGDVLVGCTQSVDGLLLWPGHGKWRR